MRRHPAVRSSVACAIVRSARPVRGQRSLGPVTRLVGEAKRPRTRLVLDVPPNVLRTAQWLPLAVIAAYAVVFAARLPRTIATLYANADVASGPVLALLAGTQGPGQQVVLGNYPWYEALWLQQGLHALGAGLGVLAGAPFVAGLATAALVAWATAVVGGSVRVGALAAIAILAGGPEAWTFLGSWTSHGLTWLHVALLGAFLVWVASRDKGASTLLIAGIVGLSTGVAAASDSILFVAGIVPLVVGTVSARRQRVTVPVAVCLTATIIGLICTRVIAANVGVTGADTFPIEAAGISDLPQNFSNVMGALAVLSNGRALASSDPFSPASTGPAIGLGIVAALTAVVVAIRVARFRGPTGSSVRAHVSFWCSSAVATVAAVLFTTVSENATCARYLFGVVMALAALAPLGARTLGARAAAGLVTALFAAAGVAMLLGPLFVTDGARAPTRSDARALTQLARSQRIGATYAGYWTAMPISFKSDLELPVRSLEVCNAHARVCPFELHKLSSWYVPRRRTRSMLIADPRILAFSVSVLDPRLGRPEQVVRVGGLTVAIFADDIAARLGPPVRHPLRSS